MIEINFPPYYFYFVFLAIMSLWMPLGRYFWFLPYAVATIWATIEGGIEFQGLICHLAYLIVCFHFFNSHSLRWFSKKGQLFFVIGFAFLLKQHLIFPGFNNWRVVSGIKLTPSSAPFTFWMNLDSSVIGLFLLGLDPNIRFLSPRKDFLQVLKKGFPVLATASGALIVSAWIFGYIRFEPKWFSFTPWWLGSQLLFTCITEEVLFRKFIQSHLIKKLGKMPGLILASSIFGLAHYTGGPMNELLGMIAGLFYGYAYLVTQSLEGAILVHFLVNAVHFLFFSYPCVG